MQLKLKGAHEVLSKQVPPWCGQLEPLDDEHCTLDMGADSIEMLVTMMVMVGHGVRSAGCARADARDAQGDGETGAELRLKEGVQVREPGP